jgi:hypothetical protein
LKARIKLAEARRKDERLEYRRMRSRLGEVIGEVLRGRTVDSKLSRGLLGLRRDKLTVNEIQAAYRTKVKQLHPDQGGGGDSDVMPTLQAARDHLLRLATDSPDPGKQEPPDGPRDPQTGEPITVSASDYRRRRRRRAA